MARKYLNGVDFGTTRGTNLLVAGSPATTDAINVGYLATAQARGTTTVTTSSLTTGSIDSSHPITLALTYRILAIRTTRIARVRLYNTAANQSADLTRPIGVDPDWSLGLNLEFITAVSNTTYPLCPPAVGANMESTPSAVIAMSVTNLGVVGTLNVILTWEQVE